MNDRGIIDIPQKQKDKFFPRLGNRDIVSFGLNGEPVYFDLIHVPIPSIRFGANTPAVLELRKKELGDWKGLSLQDKKALYRASFQCTLSESIAPDGRWKQTLAITFAFISIGILFNVIITKFFMNKLPSAATPEGALFWVKFKMDQRKDPIDGFASRWDYENNRWKK